MNNYTIAVYMHNLNEIVSFFESNSMRVYTIENNNWTVKRTVAYDKPEAHSISVLRKQISEIMKLVSDCDIIAGKELLGIPFSIFDMAGFHIFTIGEISDKVFFGIISDIEKGDEEKRMKEEIIKNACPVGTHLPGVYYLDLIMLQTECPEVSSKKAMMSFFDTTPFLELRLICRHIPPWLENSGKYDIKTERHNDCFSAVITKKC